MADSVTWADGVQAVGAVAIPVVGGWLAIRANRLTQRNEHLLGIRMQAYQQVAPKLNKLMCYMTFIGTWRDTSPLEMVVLKRELDAEMHVAMPLFSDTVQDVYRKFMGGCFETFNDWGTDARIVSSAYRRREGWQSIWLPELDDMFAYSDEQAIDGAELQGVRQAYDALIGALVKDLSVTRARAKYTTDTVSLNAHAPQYTDVEGSA